ncbi:unnamed protein product [Bursaphelenchus xylophilus]|nr:unnamed protein product [Bursaphelenchus xylophilus]CAG9120486.1 unnamed protein product [Bursaphelenchus xylophilus]
MANQKKQGEKKKEEKKSNDQQQKHGVPKPKAKPTPYATILKEMKSTAFSTSAPSGDHCVQLVGMLNRITRHDLLYKKSVVPALKKLDVVWRHYSHRHPAEAKQVEEDLMELDNPEPEDQPGPSNSKDNSSKGKKAKSKKANAEEDQAE